MEVKVKKKTWFVIFIIIIGVFSACGKNGGEMKELNQVENAGDRFEMGMWKDVPIIWRALEVKDGNVLAISDEVIGILQYDGLAKEYGERLIESTLPLPPDTNGAGAPDVNKTWADSEIRAWLNDDFLNAAFTDDELSRVVESEIKNAGGEADIDGAADTKDKIFLLSAEEANAYFENDKNRIASLEMTDIDLLYMLRIYEEDMGVPESSIRSKLEEQFLHNKQDWPWWLRSTGSANGTAVMITTEGSIVMEGWSILDFRGGVRPALWIELDSQ
jgi:hypothetical protein